MTVGREEARENRGRSTSLAYSPTCRPSHETAVEAASVS